MKTHLLWEFIFEQEGLVEIFKNKSHLKTSIDVLPSKNQVLCEYCTHVSKLNTADTLISLFPF